MQILLNVETADHTQWKHQQLDHTWRKPPSDLVLWCTSSTQTHQDNNLDQDLPKGRERYHNKHPCNTWYSKHKFEFVKASTKTHCWDQVGLIWSRHFYSNQSYRHKPFSHRDTLYFQKPCTNHRGSTGKKKKILSSLQSHAGNCWMWLQRGLDHITHFSYCFLPSFSMNPTALRHPRLNS